MDKNEAIAEIKVLLKKWYDGHETSHPSDPINDDWTWEDTTSLVFFVDYLVEEVEDGP